MFGILCEGNLYEGAVGHLSCQHGAVRYEVGFTEGLHSSEVKKKKMVGRINLSRGS